MKNVYSTPLRYENFNGQKRSTTLYFHITPREFSDWVLANREEAEELQADFADMQQLIEDNPDSTATQDQLRSMLRLVKVLAEIAHGKPSEDGEFFDKSDSRFRYSAAYDAFRMFLFENPKELTTFINTILNSEVIAEFTHRIADGASNVELEQKKAELGEKQLDRPKDEIIADMERKLAEMKSGKA